MFLMFEMGRQKKMAQEVEFYVDEWLLSPQEHRALDRMQDRIAHYNSKNEIEEQQQIYNQVE